MCEQMQACADEFLATVTEGVVHSVYKVLTWSSFGSGENDKPVCGFLFVFGKNNEIRKEYLGTGY